MREGAAILWTCRVAVLEILEVYPSDKWDDTCIAEIQVLNASGQECFALEEVAEETSEAN